MANNGLTSPDMHHFLAPFILIFIFPFVFEVLCFGLVIAKYIQNTLTEEDVMKRLMEMFEDIMVAAAFAEEGVSVSFLRQKNNIHDELGEQAWDLM